MDKGKTNIQRDWEQREFIEDVTVNIKKVTEFLNRFGTASSSTILYNFVLINCRSSRQLFVGCRNALILRS
jgi:hypothetical protein